MDKFEALQRVKGLLANETPEIKELVVRALIRIYKINSSAASRTRGVLVHSQVANISNPLSSSQLQSQSPLRD